MKNAKRFIIELSEVFALESSAGYDLWTWLPSHVAARKFHGDSYHNHRPNTHHLLVEASEYIMFLRGNVDGSVDTGWFECPCGDSHEESREQILARVREAAKT